MKIGWLKLATSDLGREHFVRSRVRPTLQFRYPLGKQVENLRNMTHPLGLCTRVYIQHVEHVQHVWVENRPMNPLSGEKELSQFFVVQLMETNLQTRFGISPTTAFFFIYSTKIIAQSSKVASKIQRKGKNVAVGVAPSQL